MIGPTCNKCGAPVNLFEIDSVGNCKDTVMCDYTAELQEKATDEIDRLRGIIKDTNDWLIRSGLGGTAHQRALEKEV